MKVAVTGGAGYIGSALIRKLLELGHEVASVDNLRIGDYKHLHALKAGPRLRLRVGDIRDMPLLREAFAGADAVAHLAALPGLVLCNENPEEAVSVNVYGTHCVLQAAKECGVKRIVFASTAATYGVPEALPVTEDHPQRPLNLYGVTKLANEKQLYTFNAYDGLETVSLRFGNVYGVGLYARWVTVIPKFVNLAFEGKPLTIYGDGTSSRDYVHVDDIVQAMVLGLSRPGIGGEAFNVGSEPTTIGDVARYVAEEVEAATGHRVESVNLPPRPGETKEFTYDLTKIKSRLGFRPEWTVRKGIKQLIDLKKKEV